MTSQYSGGGERALSINTPAFSQLMTLSSDDRPSSTSSGVGSDFSDQEPTDDANKLKERIKELETELEIAQNKNMGFESLRSLSNEDSTELARCRQRLKRVEEYKKQLESRLSQMDSAWLNATQSEWKVQSHAPDMSQESFNVLAVENIKLKQQLQELQAQKKTSLESQPSSTSSGHESHRMDVTPPAGPGGGPGGGVSELCGALRSLLDQYDRPGGGPLPTSLSYPSHLTDLSREPAKLSMQSEVTAAENAQLKQQLVQLDKQVQELAEMNARWQSYNEQRETFVQELQRRAAREGERSAQLGEEQQQQVDSLIQQYKRKVAAAEDDKIKVEGDNRHLRRELEELRRKSSEQEQEMISLQSRVEQLSRRRTPGGGGSAEDSDTIAMLKAQIQICTEDFRSESRDKERATARVSELERELAVTKRQLTQFQTSFMDSYSERRASALKQYEEEYKARVGGVGGRTLMERGVFQTDGDSDEDVLDVPSLPAPSRSSEHASRSSEHTGLSCPRCKKEFGANQHTALLDHIDVCCD